MEHPLAANERHIHKRPLYTDIPIVIYDDRRRKRIACSRMGMQLKSPRVDVPLLGIIGLFVIMTSYAWWMVLCI